MFFLSLNIWFLDKTLTNNRLEYGYVSKVIDGDTGELDTGDRVRLDSINETIKILNN